MTETQTSQTQVTEESYPGPADYRRLFPHSATLEHVHRLETPDGVSHLRNPFRRFGDHGPDAAICSDTYRTPEGSTYDLTKKGRLAVSASDCADCKRIIAETVAQADEELAEIAKEAQALADSAKSFRHLSATFNDGTPDGERERVGAEVRGREATLTVLRAFRR